MFATEFGRVRAASAYFFFCPGLVYGIFTARLPALKAQTGATEAETGLILLCIGAASLLTLLSSGRLLRRFGSRPIVLTATIVMPVSLIFAGFATAPWMLGGCCALLGLAMGVCDVAMNVIGMTIERRHHRPVMSSLHGAYSVGGVVGAVSGSIFAGLSLGPEVNAIVMLAIYFIFRRPARRALPGPSGEHHGGLSGDGAPNQGGSGRVRPAARSGMPAFVLLCGAMAACAFASEGAVAEWGGLLMSSEKGAPEHLAALVYAVFCTVTAVIRASGDAIRSTFDNYPLLIGGSILAAVGMVLVLEVSNPFVVLAGFAVMGLGLGPIVPVLFSLAGNRPDIDVVRVSTMISILGYAGLLVAPPFLGFVSEHFSIAVALRTVVVMCVGIFAGSLALRLLSRRP